MNLYMIQIYLENKKKNFFFYINNTILLYDIEYNWIINDYIYWINYFQYIPEKKIFFFFVKIKGHI